MALTESQIQDCLMAMNLSVDTAAAFGIGGDSEWLRTSEYARQALGKVNVTQEQKITGILTQWTEIRYETDTIKAEGLDSNPFRARAFLSRQLFLVLGIPQVSSLSIGIQRG